MHVLDYRKWTALIAAVLLAAGSIGRLHAAEETQADVREFEATHKQARFIKPMHEGKPVSLNTFCLDRDGNILACVGGESVQYVVSEDGSQQAKTIESPQQLQVYSPDGGLIRAVDLTFKPTAVNTAPDGSIFVAGTGKVAHVSAEGKLLTTVDSPHIGDIETFRQRIDDAAKVQMEANTSRYRDQIIRIEERITALKEKPEVELTELDKKRLETYEQQKTLYKTQLKAMEQSGARVSSGTAAVSRKLGITALAVTGKDLFLCCNSVAGNGYEVWRMTHEFSEPVQVSEPAFPILQTLASVLHKLQYQSWKTNL